MHSVRALLHLRHLATSLPLASSTYTRTGIGTPSRRCPADKLLGRRKFKVKNSFALVELSLLIRIGQFFRALHIAEGILRARANRVWDASPRGLQVLIANRCVLSGQGRFIRYFSRDLSTHSLIPLRFFLVAQNFQFFFLPFPTSSFLGLETIFFPRHPLC